MSSGELIEVSVCRNFRQTAVNDAFDARRKEAYAVAADEEDIEVLKKMAKDFESWKKGIQDERS